MLNKQEIVVMKSLYEVCRKHNDSGIIENKWLVESAPEKFKLNDSDIDTILKQLEYDGYIECTKSERKGITVNVVTLKQKGKAFQRELVQRRRELFNTFFWRCVFAALGAVVALIVSRLLASL